MSRNIQLLVIENTAHGFLKPNIIDIKLGTILWDEDALPAKKERMQNAAKRTTSGETGVRLTGFQVCRGTLTPMSVDAEHSCESLLQVFGNTTPLPVIFPKSYGKTIGVSELRAGVARFFPISGSLMSGSQILRIHTSTLHYRVHSDLPGAESGGRMDVGLPRTLLLPVLKSIRKGVQEIRDVLSAMEMRMVGSSLLIIYEGDWHRAEMGVQWLAEQAASATRDGRVDGGGREFKEVEEDDSEDDDESEDESEDERRGYKSPCVVKVIDFAHTRLKPGEGPDQSVLRGLETVLALLDGRIMDCMTS